MDHTDSPPDGQAQDTSRPLTVLVTGASRGIGLEFVRAWLGRGAQVIATARDPASATDLHALLDQYAQTDGETEPENERLRIMQLDVRDDRSVELLSSSLAGTRIDLLINNAGILTVETLDNLDMGAVVEQLKVNALGPLRVTAGLSSHLRDGARVVNMTSRMGSIEDNTSGGYYGYRMSKAALNMATRSLAVDLKGRGIVVIAMHPGMVQTDMTRGYGMLSATESVASMNEVIERLTPQQSGLFLHYQGTTLPW